MKCKTKIRNRLACPQKCAATRVPYFGYTLIELIVCLALMAAVIPIIVQGLHTAALAGEVSERKALAARIADRVLNETIVNGQTITATSGSEQQGPFQFHWTVKNEPWTQAGGLAANENANGVNQGVVNENLIHQLSVDVVYTAQGKNFSVHLSTLINTSQP
ncbi:MAG TPA: prepilin-type N-terminal cleavage/methylation domain-containing protein [Verrucomicrobiae bacterium]|jgi:prepilin-type N-terminal cleavage/methylation domain-containing protein|nr:prepilin-type N-terminal cleavage/methylation domain-containing protein [Verrucomicrobiae bacterium]